LESTLPNANLIDIKNSGQSGFNEASISLISNIFTGYEVQASLSCDLDGKGVVSMDSKSLQSVFHNLFMQVHLVNDGAFTIILNSADSDKQPASAPN
jgi:hypothetical protein